MPESHTLVIKALKDATGPLSTAALAQTIGMDEMRLHMTLRRLLNVGTVERRIEAGEARWSCAPPPKVEIIKVKRLGRPGRRKVCPTCSRPLGGRSA